MNFKWSVFTQALQGCLKDSCSPHKNKISEKYEAIFFCSCFFPLFVSLPLCGNPFILGGIVSPFHPHNNQTFAEKWIIFYKCPVLPSTIYVILYLKVQLTLVQLKNDNRNDRHKSCLSVGNKIGQPINIFKSRCDNCIGAVKVFRNMKKSGKILSPFLMLAVCI